MIKYIHILPIVTGVRMLEKTMCDRRGKRLTHITQRTRVTLGKR